MKEVAKENNVVQLRKNHDHVPLQTIEDSIDEAVRIRQELSQDMTEMAMEQVMGFFTSYGVLKEMNKVDGRDLIMLENSIQAVLHRYYGLDHPLHEVTEEVFDFSDEE